MRIVHVTYGFLPDPIGGTEQYVAALARELRTLGVDSVIAAPGPTDASYEHGGLAVRRFHRDPAPSSLEVLYGDGDPRAAAAFGYVLDHEAPDLVHLHAFSPACSVALVHMARERGIPVVFTYHTPTVSCARGTLMRWGTEACEGRLDLDTCTACTLQGLGLDRVTSRLLARTPASIAEALARTGASGGPWTALRMRALIALRHASVQGLFAACDRIVAMSPWVEQLLDLAAVPREKIVVSRHGIDTAPDRAASVRHGSAGPLRIAHLGRLDPTKGTDLLIRAVIDAARIDLEIDIFGIVEAGSFGHVSHLQRLADSDARIRLLPAIDHSEVVPRLREYDLVAVPSQWLETGPLVVLEAFAAGVPVIGSALGGIADKVRDGVDGLLVTPHDSAAAWRDALARCAGDRLWVATLRAQVRQPRAMSAVALDMRALYLGELTATA